MMSRTSILSLQGVRVLPFGACTKTIKWVAQTRNSSNMRLQAKDLNPNVVAADYAVRGKLAIRAEELREQLHNDPNSLPFKQIINANIGNPQQLDQKPVTFFRQVLALVQYPELMETAANVFPKDVIARAKYLLDDVASVGAYSTSTGAHSVRVSVANYIAERDGFPADPEQIFLSGGASSSVSKLMTLMAHGPKTGIMIPIPQYPLYSATITLLDNTQVDYYLSEEKNWGIDTDNLHDAYDKAVSEGVDPRLLVVINPGNPTGSILSDAEIRDILKWAYEKKLVILADEVYQTNVFRGKFISFKQARAELIEEDPKYEAIQLASVHSTSKGFVGECGQRGGYMECVGFTHEFMEQLYKLSSIELCPVVTGQILTELMVNPPKEGDESYPLYKKETDHILQTLHDRAHELHAAFDTMENLHCNDPEGAMYLFPTIYLPPKAIEAAEKRGEPADAMYCMELLEQTGICVIPGSGFGQKPGTLHFRTTFLAPGGKALSDLFINFHKDFMKRYS